MAEGKQWMPYIYTIRLSSMLGTLALYREFKHYITSTHLAPTRTWTVSKAPFKINTFSGLEGGFLSRIYYVKTNHDIYKTVNGCIISGQTGNAI